MNIELWVNILLPIFSIAIPVFATVYTVNNRIRNENKENHMPHIVLQEVQKMDKINNNKYHITLIGRNFYEQNKQLKEEQIIDLEFDNDIYVDLMLKNIGYGVATNIKFYNLLTGTKIYGTQSNNENLNQKLFTTQDIASGDTKNTQTRIINSVIEEEGIIKEDHNRIICIYQDLNKNIYDFIISINIKKGNHYDFFAFQPSSASYQKWIKENKKNYKKVYKLYKSY